MSQLYKAWFEKYRPTVIGDVIFPNDDIQEIITDFANQEFISGNILSYGPPGFGKSTVSEVLIHQIIKDRNDIFILGRKTEDVDNLRRWLQQKPVHSKQKIVKIEEMDRLSTQAQVVLKDGLMEKYQLNTSFLATTNNPQKIDPALLTRFNIKINFGELPLEPIIKRLEFILQSENVEYQYSDLEEFVKRYHGRGLRDLINNLELASHGKVFNPTRIEAFSGTTQTEEMIINYIKYLIKYTETKSGEEILHLINQPQDDPKFWPYYEYMLKTFKNDLRFNYDALLNGLLEEDFDLMQKKVITEYYQDLDLKRFKSMHIIAMISDLLELIYKQKGNILQKVG